MKDVLIVSHEGNVRLNNVPANIKREKLVNLARYLLQDKLKKPIVDLYNVEYYKNSEIYELIEKNFGGYDDLPDDFYDVVKEYGDE